MAEHVETEQAEDRLHGDALQAVGAAGEPAILVGEFAEHEGDAERHHDARQVRAAQHEEARHEADRARDKPRGDQRQHRLIDDLVLGEQRRRIGADAEERGVAERDDAGIAEDEIEREREQRQDRDLGQNEMLAGKQPDRGESRDPEDDFQRMPARAGGHAARDATSL